MAGAALALGLAASFGPLRYLGGPGRGAPAASSTSNRTSLKAVTAASPISTSHLAAAVAGTPTKPSAPAAAASPLPAQPTWQLADISNRLVSKWVSQFTTTMRGDFETYLSRMSTYASTIASEIEARSMPQELVYLPLIESGYKPTAKSPAKATGLWQFMTATARRYGLVVTSKVDERKDPAKETGAALSYLDDLYHEFGSWYLAAAAYNAGEGRVRNALEKVTGKTTGTDADFYRIASALPAETRDYVPKLIAAATIAKDPAKYGFTVDPAAVSAGGNNDAN